MSTRDTMLEIARKAILQRAALDGYSAEEYDPVEDAEGYVISLLTALRHWCDANSIDWDADLGRAQELFKEDLREDSGNPSDEVEVVSPHTLASTPDSAPKKARTYMVGVREIHVRFYKVMAENEGQAKNLVNERAPQVEDIGFEEFSDEMDRETWSVEESTE